METSLQPARLRRVPREDGRSAGCLMAAAHVSSPDGRSLILRWLQRTFLIVERVREQKKNRFAVFLKPLDGRSAGIVINIIASGIFLYNR